MITPAQGACLGLMAELQRICDENQLRAYLIDKQLWATQTEGIIIGYEADFAMFYDDFVKFRAAAEKEFGCKREFESYEENQSLPGVYYRYVNAETTFFNMDEFKLFQKQGIYVNIHIIRSSGNSQNALSIYEWAMGKGLHKSRRADFYGGIVKLERRLAGEDFQKKRVLRLYKECRIVRDGKTEIKLPMGKRLVFPKGFWNKQKKCNLSGYTFTTVDDTNRYLSAQFGVNWQDRKITAKKETYMCTCCTNLPYRKYWEYMGEDILDEEFFSKREAYFSAHKENIKDYNSQTRKAWDVFFSIDEQFRLQNRIKEYKDDVISRWNSKNHDSAILMMGDYVIKIEEYRKKKVALVADEDLWGLYIEWLLENGRDGIANRLLESVRKGQLGKAK